MDTIPTIKTGSDKTMNEWRETTNKRGRIRTDIFSLDDCNGLNGDEIFFNECNDVSMMSSFYMAKWKQKNRNSQTIMNNRTVLTLVKIGGRVYPFFIKITEDFSPLILGNDFFQANNWTVDENRNIDTPYGKLLTVGGDQIDNDLAESVYAANEISASKGTKEDKIRKLHKYFGHTGGRVYGE